MLPRIFLETTMYYRAFALPLLIATLISSACSSSPRATLILADGGRSNYTIVIAQDAPEGIQYAARELTHFLKAMTGVELPTVDDTTSPGPFEIVVGETNRKRLADVPESLRPKVLEGLVILPEGERLFIMGNSTRGTLYGVYDWLEQDLGVRFLGHGPIAVEKDGATTIGAINHAPDRPTLRVRARARRYDPPMEYRNVCWAPDFTWGVRNRLNAIWSSVPKRKQLGGVKWVGSSFVHTFEHLVPTEEFFDEHPEYFSLIDGERRREWNGIWTQLCMTNPDVLRILTDRVKNWVQEGRVHPDDKLIASVTVNDSSNFCQCDPCRAVNAEEGVKEGGTLIRLVNAVAREVRKEHPNALIETLGYAGTQPTKTPPESNVMIRWVGAGPWDFKIDEHRSMQPLLQWNKLIGDGGLYTWFNLPVTSEMLYPCSNLFYIDHNIRVLVDHKVIGMYGLATEGPGTDVFSLRSYMLARCMWRPETNGREAVQEFCRLYYGEEAAPFVFKYLADIHAHQKHRTRDENHRPDKPDTFSGPVLHRANALLARAEDSAATRVQKLRVAELRMQPWYFMVDAAYGSAGQLVQLPNANWHFKYDGKEDEAIRGDREGWSKVTDFDDSWRRMDIDRHWTFQDEERRGTAWYAIEFEMPAVGTDAKPALSFKAVDGEFEAYIDGTKVGERKGLPLDHIWQHHRYVPLAETPTPGRHVLTLRVKKNTYAAGIWKPISIVDLAAPISPELYEAAVRMRQVSEQIQMVRISEAYGTRTTQIQKVFWHNLEHFYRHRPKPGAM